MDAELKLIFHKLKGLSPVCRQGNFRLSGYWRDFCSFAVANTHGMSTRNNSFLMVDIFLFWQKVLIFQFICRGGGESMNLNPSDDDEFTVSHLPPLTGHEAPGSAAM